MKKCGLLQLCKPCTASELFYHNSLDQSIFIRRVSGYFLLLLYVKENPVNANSVYLDQTPHSDSVASDLGLHCLPITLLGYLDKTWVKG